MRSNMLKDAFIEGYNHRLQKSAGSLDDYVKSLRTWVTDKDLGDQKGMTGPQLINSNINAFAGGSAEIIDAVEARKNAEFLEKYKNTLLGGGLGAAGGAGLGAAISPEESRLKAIVIGSLIGGLGGGLAGHIVDSNKFEDSLKPAYQKGFREGAKFTV